MKKPSEADLKCGRCDGPVADSDTFCPSCGALFRENISCIDHPSVEAEGVCVICSLPACDACGVMIQKVFFCNRHSAYEFYEGMAKVYGNTDNVQAQYAAQCLEQAGFHPFLYSRRFNPCAAISQQIPVRNFGRGTIAELKVMVPFPEVLNAGKILKKLRLPSY